MAEMVTGAHQRESELGEERAGEAALEKPIGT